MNTFSSTSEPAAVRLGVGLSSRQNEVLSLMAQGLNRHEVARRLDLSYYTVGEHTKKIYRRLGVHNRVAAVAAAAKTGLIEMSRERAAEFMPPEPAGRGGRAGRAEDVCCPHCGHRLERAD